MKELSKTERRIFALFTRQPLFIISILSDHYPFSLEQIENFKSKIDWTNFGLSGNENLSWSIELIKNYESRWRWEILLRNKGIIWDQKLIDYLKSKLQEWKNSKSNFRRIENLGYKRQLIDQIEKHIEIHENILNESTFINNGLTKDTDFTYHELMNEHTINFLSKSPYLDFTEEFLSINKDHFNWNVLSENKHIPWTTKLIETFEKKWNWKKLSANSSLPWCSEFIRKFINNWYWEGIESVSYNSEVPWDQSMMEEFQDYIDWEMISKNQNINFTFNLISKFENKLDFNSLSSSRMRNINWSFKLLKKYRDRWNWKSINYNKDINWSTILFQEFENEIRWNKDGLSNNESIPWTEKIIDSFLDKWQWKGSHGLSHNPTLPLSLELIEKYDQKWDWGYLALNKSTWHKVFKWHMNDNLVNKIFSEIKSPITNNHDVIVDIQLK